MALITALDEKAYDLEAGRLCLEFANTLDWHGSDHPEETLHSYTDLLRWSASRKVVDAGEAALLQDQAEHEPELALQIYRQALDLREAIYRTFSSLAAGGEPTLDDLDVLNESLARAFPHLRIAGQAQAFGWRWVNPEGALDRPLWDVALSAARLLESDELDRVRECADEHGCGWMFMDTSRNRSRRWCSMEGCGNRAKARRHYARINNPSPGSTGSAREPRSGSR
jgi:predicted RNA-binding Zn ribbon-like protein